MTMTTAPSTSLAPGTRRGVRILGWICLGLGLLVAAFIAFLAWNQVHPGLDPVPYGSTVVVEQHGITGGAVFATDGTQPTCTVDGEKLTFPSDETVVIDGMRMVYTFSTSFPEQSGRQYTVVCTATTPGQFAATQYQSGWLFALVFGAPALLLLGVGGLLLFLGRRSRTSSEVTTEHSMS